MSLLKLHPPVVAPDPAAAIISPMLPHRWVLLGAALLATGALAGVVIAWGLPRASRYARGPWAVIPQLLASGGAGCAVWGWFAARRLITAWRLTDTPPGPELEASLNRVIGWSQAYGAWQAAALLACLMLAAQPIWRGRAHD